jgi:hypothetical protein
VVDSGRATRKAAIMNHIASIIVSLTLAAIAFAGDKLT